MLKKTTNDEKIKNNALSPLLHNLFSLIKLFNIIVIDREEKVLD